MYDWRPGEVLGEEHRLLLLGVGHLACFVALLRVFVAARWRVYTAVGEQL